jgi:hypothetical protein
VLFIAILGQELRFKHLKHLTLMVSTHSINKVVFVTDTQYILCEVGSEFLDII